MQKILILAGLTCILACQNKKESTQIPISVEAVPVRVMKPVMKEISSVVSASGQFTTDDEAILSFKTGGIVESILVKEGQYVKKGQLLAILDLTEIKASVAQATIALHKAERDFERIHNLYKENVGTLEQYQNAETAVGLARQHLNAAEFNLAHSKIFSLADGYVLKKFINQGQLVNSGTPILQTNGAGKGEWILKAGLSDKEWALIKVGDEANIHVDAFPGQSLAGVVIRKSEGADQYTGGFIADIQIKGKELPSLATGLFGTAIITPSHKTFLWPIPYEALLEGNYNEAFVFLTQDGKYAKKVPVKVVSLGKNEVYISSGLDTLQKLILSGSAYLSDNSPIIITE